MSEQDVLDFVNITGASTEVAKNFLEIADNDLETAVTLFLENGGAETREFSRPASVHSEENILTDEEIARQIQESENQVRAPIAARTEILTGVGSSFHPSPSWTPTRENVSLGRPSIFNQGDSTTGSVSDFINRLQDDVSPTRSSAESPSEASRAKSRRLADLFRPPFDIMYRGSFEEAKDTAKENNKWLMVNIQDPTEFSCQVMNRDLWSDTFVKDIIKESFVFLQYTNTSAEGLRYITLYRANSFPHVAIIDGLTGEKVKVWEKELKPVDFMMEVTEFLERKSSGIKQKERSVSDMSEQEQLDAAIAASLSRSVSNNDEDDDDIVPDIKDESSNMDIEEEEKIGSIFDKIKAVEREETTDINNSTRIQLRMGDGSRVIRRFLKSDPVQYLFEFVKTKVPEPNQQFELVFNRIQLIELLDKSISEAGLNNAAVNCVFI